MTDDRSRSTLFLLLASATFVTSLIHIRYVPEHFPDNPGRVAPFLVAGWLTYALVFYALGRLLSTPAALPSMRGGDVGAALFLLSLLAAAGLDTLGFSPELVPTAYTLPAIGIYSGLALVGWSIGKRTRAINRLSGE